MVLSIFQAPQADSQKGELPLEKLQKFAILDTETTGIYPNRDRVIEVAIIHCDSDGNREDEYVTLINPNRDLGPTNIHGIRAGDVKNAPTFSEAAGDILARLNNRIIVGHNIQFDIGMLSTEFARLETKLPQPPAVCTLRLAYAFGPKSRKLGDCCLHFGIDHSRQHSALDDAEVTRQLFLRYLQLANEKGIQSLASINAYRHGIDCHLWPDLPASGKTARRSRLEDLQVHPFLSTLLARLPEADKADIAIYCDLLDRALEDRRLDENEIEELMTAALAGGLTKHEILIAHREYLHGVIETALSDNVLSVAERNDVNLVANLLGFDSDFVNESIDRIASAPRTTAVAKPSANSLANKTVCFTGTTTCTIGGASISRAQMQEFAQNNQMTPVSSVSKKTDILVMADPDSLSGKAKKARECGTRIIADRVFLSMIGVDVD